MRLLKRALRTILLIIMLVLCAGLFYLLVILGGAPGGESAAAPVATTAPLAAMPQSKLSFSADNLYQAEAYFNAPILTLSSGSGWQLSEVVVSESAPSGAGVSVREVRLSYVDTASSVTVQVSSLTPARYLRALPGRGFFAAADQDTTLLGQGAVLMQSGDTLHVHLQKGEVIYQLEGNVGLDTLRRAAGAAGL